MEEKNKTGSLSLVGHLEELRQRLWVCIASVLLFSIVGFSAAPRVIEWLKRPAGASLPTLVFFSPPEAILAYMRIGVGVGIFLSMPVLLYELWLFVRPGLKPKERFWGVSFVFWGSLLFAGGVSFAYWGLLPVSLPFLLTFGGGTLQPVISISQYLSFTMAVILTCGIVFELPVAVFFLTKLGVVTPQFLRRKWKIAFLGSVVAAAVLTPTPDVVNLTLMTVPLLVLYAASVAVSAFALSPKKSKSLPQAAK